MLAVIAWRGERLTGLAFYAVFALAITITVQLIGVYLVFTSLIVPALAVRRLRHTWRLPVGYAVGALGYLLGLILSARFDLPSGAVVVLVMAALAPLMAALARRWAAADRP